jgi:hypothetical protein
VEPDAVVGRGRHLHVRDGLEDVLGVGQRVVELVAVGAATLGEVRGTAAAAADPAREFADHFAREMAALGDDSLQQELEILQKLASYDG